MEKRGEIMTRKDYEKAFRSGRKCIGEHNPLTALTFANDDEQVGGWGEILFVVEEKWLLDYMENTTKEKWNSDQLRNWLREEYTSEDSRQIFEKAAGECQLVAMNIFYTF